MVRKAKEPVTKSEQGKALDSTVTTQISDLKPPKNGDTPDQEHAVFDLGDHCTDFGNTERLLHTYGRAVRYSSTRKKWLHWRHKRWEWNDGARINFLAKEVVGDIYREASDCQDTVRRQELGKHALKSESERAVSAMVELLKSELGIPINLDDLDTDNWLLNCQNGTIDLKTGELRPHHPGDYITRILDIDYDPRAECPLWMKYLAKVTGNNGSLIDYLQRAVGYSLTGDCSQQVLFFFYGLGENGKSTFLTAIRNMLCDYAQRAPIDTFLLKDKTSGPQESLADMKGKRLVTASELEDNRVMAVSLVKDLTGGETIKVDRKYEHQFEFLPTFKIWLGGNHKPTIKDTTLSIWRRVKLIPFTVTIKPEERDYKLGAKLRAEYPGILAWAVRGCLEWLQRGLEEPEAIRIATAQYRSDSDILHDFLEDCCILEDKATLIKATLREKYEEWSKENHQDAITQRTFKARLIEKGITELRTGNKGTRAWCGIRLTEDADNADKS